MTWNTRNIAKVEAAATKQNLYAGKYMPENMEKVLTKVK
jgi:hypothetical protein